MRRQAQRDGAFEAGHAYLFRKPGHAEERCRAAFATAVQSSGLRRTVTAQSVSGKSAELRRSLNS